MNQRKQGLQLVIIMPTASVDDWLDEAVASILTQINGTDRLVIVHDGVEPDTSRSWTSHPSVAIIHSQTRQGVARSLRRAIDMTDAPLIARMDADDIAMPARLSTQRQYLSENDDVVMVGTRAHKIDHNGDRLGPFIATAGDRIRHQLLRENVIIHSSIMFRRDAYDQTSGYVAEFAMSEDYHLWLTMALVGEVTVLNEELMLYRTHPKQATKRIKQTGPHMVAIVLAQKKLALTLGVGSFDSARRRARWIAIQYAMATRVDLLRLREALRGRWRERLQSRSWPNRSTTKA
jgi:glycosyltransferase involved in cell wall biosynthesis